GRTLDWQVRTRGRMTDMFSDAPPPDDKALLEPLGERNLASELFNLTWDFMGMESRTPAEDDAMVHAAHASRWHWGKVGGPEQWAIGEWLCSRVYAVLGRGEQSLYHGRRSREICTEFEVGSFVPASAHEAMARAYCVLGDMDAARAERNLSYAAAIDLDDDDRAVIEGDLATLPITQ
ncbi:MAG: hypothetical protein ACR2JS_01330, partial [Candidatus Nanopelagicales bacterium]